MCPSKFTDPDGEPDALDEAGAKLDETQQALEETRDRLKASAQAVEDVRRALSRERPPRG